MTATLYPPPPADTLRTCRDCGEMQPDAEFVRVKRDGTGSYRWPTCPPCQVAARERRRSGLPRIEPHPSWSRHLASLGVPRPRAAATSKICRDCGADQPIAEFRRWQAWGTTYAADRCAACVRRLRADAEKARLDRLAAGDVAAAPTKVCADCGDEKARERFGRRGCDGGRKARCNSCVGRRRGRAAWTPDKRLRRSRRARARYYEGLGIEPCLAAEYASDEGRWKREKVARRAAGALQRKAVRRAARERIVAEVLQRPCLDCGLVDPVVMEFDHRDPSTKSASVSRLLARANVRPDRVLAEIAKCDVVCANCHRRRTAKMFGSWRTVLASEAT